MLDHVINSILSDLNNELHNKNQNLNDSLISISKADHPSKDFEESMRRITSLLEVLADLFSLQSQSDRQIEHIKVNRCFKLVVGFISVHNLTDSSHEKLNTALLVSFEAFLESIQKVQVVVQFFDLWLQTYRNEILSKT